VPEKLECGELDKNNAMMRSLIHQYFRYLLSGLPRVMRRAVHSGPGSEAARARGFSGDRSGVVAVLVGLAMPVLVGAMGLAAEASYWYVHQRGMQNAADAAAIAAATNGTSTYAAEAQAVVAGFYPNGLGTITVAAK
jgi:Flp pilus assembly protein TadG